jgi:FMN phosphatase YigB (HAD superfamily)
MDHLGISGGECLVVDDHLPTLTAARALGMTAVYVGKEQQVEADYQIGEIKGLEGALRGLQLLGEGGGAQ